MKQTKKNIFLVITLAIPLVIFIFLRIFGDNRFDIPVFYQSGVDREMIADCNFGEGQFNVPDSLAADDRATLFLFYKKSEGFDDYTLKNQINRLEDLLNQDMPAIRLYTSEVVGDAGVEVTVLSEEVLKHLMNCALVVENFNRYILVDQKQRIRGYFDTDLDEIDRLIVELEILMENGSNN